MLTPNRQQSTDFLPIDFIIIGGSICGLSTAISLRRAGHNVTVFDFDDPFVQVRTLRLVATPPLLPVSSLEPDPSRVPLASELDQDLLPLGVGRAAEGSFRQDHRKPLRSL